MNLSARAFTLLEFLVFILVLSVLISAILGSLAVIGLENSEISQKIDIYNVPFCNKIMPHCVFHSQILESSQIYEINATIP